MNYARIKKALAFRLGFVFLFAFVAFQNCSGAKFSSTQTDVQYSGNGDGYSGKPDQFRHFDPARPCREADRLGKALPNDEIFFQPRAVTGPRVPHMVRENCRDIAPAELDARELVFTPASNTSFIYRGKTFSAQNPPGDFDVLASACPAGKTAIAGAARTNLMIAAQDWRQTLSAQGWLFHQGISVELNGSAQSLPTYLIRRSDPAALDEYRRASQYITLQPNTEYVFSFIAREGSRSAAAFRLYRAGPTPAVDDTLTVDFDLRAGTTGVRVNTLGTAARSTITPVANGYLCTISFTTSANGDFGTSDIGVSPNYDDAGVGRVGDSIYAGLAQLERVSDFCR